MKCLIKMRKTGNMFELCNTVKFQSKYTLLFMKHQICCNEMNHNHPFSA